MNIARLAAAPLLLAALALAGCTAAQPDASTSPTPSASAAQGAEDCADVSLVIEYGVLDADTVEACVPAGSAVDALAAADITTEGTADYGDQVVCRVDDLPSPEDESCATLPASAYWALWVKPAPDAEWEYAQEGVGTLQLTAGQSLGLVYTEGDDSTPPSE